MSLPCEVIPRIAVHKNAELQRYCFIFVKTGLDLLRDGVSYFGSDDVPENEQPASHAVPGSAISALRIAHVIEDFYGDIPNEGIYHGRRKSKRVSANGRKINLFSISSVGLAERYLEKNRVEFEPLQIGMSFI